MSYGRNRKRRRSQAFPVDQEDAEDENTEDQIIIQDVKSEQDQEESSEDNEDVEEQSKKEFEIWDAFREEHFEAIEQLPLSLHRQYILLHELDEQAQGYSKDLLFTIKEYITLRKALVARPAAGSIVHEQTPKSEPPSTPMSHLHNDRSPFVTTPMRQTSYIATRTSTPMSIPPNRVKRPHTTREMLSHTAWLSEEIQRASEEKVNLAQAAYDSVDRHIRILDQAIKEQEANIALGVRPRTHLAPILLPDLVVPGSRATRAASLPREDEDDEGAMTLGILGADDGAGEGQPQRRGRAGKKGKGRSARDDMTMDVDDTTILGRGRGGVVRSFKLNGPVMEAQPVMAIDEQRYCYCNQVSFGEMVACDNDKCEREWFHLGCMGLEKPPADDETWYCRDCQHLAKSSKRSKARQRKKR